MTYRELLELYKTGQLDEAKRKEVEAAIEKQDAIGEYLFEESEIPGLGTDAGGKGPDGGPAAGDGEEKFTSMVRGFIRRAFLKMGIVVGAVVLAVVLCAVFFLPGIVSAFYYDPTEIVGDDAETNIVTNRMSLDLAVYSELFWPGYYRNQVIAESEGYGKYAITIPQSASYNGRFTDVNGMLERGRLILYNTNVLKAPTGNAFVFPEEAKGAPRLIYGNTGESVGPAGPKPEAYEALEALDEDEPYLAYVSLADITDYEEFHQWLEGRGLFYGALWCGVYAEDGDGYYIGGSAPIGFVPVFSGDYLSWDRDAYPQLCLPDSEATEDVQTHFISMLSYLKEHDDILQIMGTDPVDFDGILRSVTQDGLRIYGFVIGAGKDTLLKLNKDPAVSYIWADMLN